jgi:hypothetical protein
MILLSFNNRPPDLLFRWALIFVAQIAFFPQLPAE